MSAASRGCGNAASGLCTATALKRAHSAAISARWRSGREVLGGGERVLNQRVLLRDRPDHAGRDLDRGHEVGRPGQDLVGRPVLLVDVDAAVAGKCPRLGAGHDDGLGVSGSDGRQPVVDDLLLGDADLAEQGARLG